MKKYIFILCFLVICIANAQIRISGKVLDNEGISLEGASVYLNNTSVGTTTNDLGEFELLINEGVYDLIVSYLGYETIQYKIDTSKPNKPLVFKTKPSDNLLDEIVIRNKKYSAEDRAYFLSRFRNTFIGKTNLSKNCQILNPDVVQFDFNPLSNILEAYISEPIEILNKDLGYKIYYDLVHYELTLNRITYLGYSRYEKLKGGKRKQKKWKKNRLRAYNGSKMHFIRAVRNSTFSEEGFVLDQSQRVPNPDRPSDSIIEETRKYLRTLNKNPKSSKAFQIISNKNLNLRANREKVIDKLKKNPEFKNVTEEALSNFKKPSAVIKKNDDGLYVAQTLASSNHKRDSAMAIVRKGRLKRFIDIKLKENLSEKDFITRSNNRVTMKFKHYLDIKYMNEKEEYNYRPGPHRLDYQVSKLILLTESVYLDKSGTFIEPLDVFMEGYWGYEKTADALPLDYDPTE